MRGEEERRRGEGFRFEGGGGGGGGGRGETPAHHLLDEALEDDEALWS